MLLLFSSSSRVLPGFFHLAKRKQPDYPQNKLGPTKSLTEGQGNSQLINISNVIRRLRRTNRTVKTCQGYSDKDDTYIIVLKSRHSVLGSVASSKLI